MMRNFAVALVAMTFLFAGNANASYTVDLIWADTGTPTLTVLPGDVLAPSSGNLCQDGAISGAGAGRCLLVQLTASSPWTASISTLGWNAASSGLAHDWTGFRSLGGLAIPGVAGPTPANALVTDCAGSGCDTAWGSFGGLSGSAVPAGVYIVGSINFDTSGVIFPGSHDILNFIRSGVDGATNKKFVPSPVQLNGAVLNVIPEPGTASLLGLGIMGLVMAGRRRKA